VTGPIISPAVGDTVYLGDIPFIGHVFGVISDLDTPDQVSASLEVFGSNGALSLSALMGPTGPSGSNAPLGQLQFQIFDSADDLPTNLTDDPIDIGKYWIVRVFDDNANQIGSNWYIWYGDHYESFKMGTAGPPGPVPVITPTFEIVDNTVTTNAKVTVTGDNYHPSWLVQINKDLVRGPVGPAGPIRQAADYDDSVAPVVGDAIKWNGVAYAPTASAPKATKFWTYPEGHFTSVGLAIGTRVPIGTALIPPIAWNTVPYVQGHFRLTGVELDATPFIIGVEVRLGNPTSGQVVARGYGNITGYVNLMAHASTASTPNDAITPDNGKALIPANSTGAASTLYVNAFNDGAAGLYNFDATGAQLSVLAIPV
jgi:hypothetical protein